MVSRTRFLSRVVFVAALALLIPAAMFAQAAGPQIVTISGDPLKINVAADSSFQVFNNAVPGSGQIFPTGCQYGDMGVFADINGTLFAPAFSAHTCGTATGGLGTTTAWTTQSISQVSGAGEGPSPFTVTVVNVAQGMGVTMTNTITYVNGDNFFRIRTSFSGPGNRTLKMFLGADIYLASSDAGIFFFEPSLHAPGGVDCQIPPTYHILLIPIQPEQANHIEDNGYNSVWTQIGQRRLGDHITPTTCIDNGAALEFDNVLGSGVSSAVIQTAVSFGAIPTITGVPPFTITIDPNAVSMTPGQTMTFNVTTVHNPDVDFNSTIDLSMDAGNPPGITATFANPHINAPGDGHTTMTVSLSPDIFPTTYRGITVLGTGGEGTVEAGSFTIDVLCDPPVLLTINNPRSQSVAKGSTATLTVTPEAGGPFKYQWYAGHAGFTSTPIAGATSSTFTTPPINVFSEFWVRVSDACGTIDSQTATIIPHN